MRYLHTIIALALLATTTQEALSVTFGNVYEKSQIAVVVHKDNPLKELSRAELAKIFLGKRNFWSWGQANDTCDLVEHGLDEQKTSRAIFSQRYLHKDLMILKNYWIKMIFSGKGHPPTRFSDAKEVINFVSGKKNRIGYLPVDKVNSKVKVLKIFDDTK